MHGNRAGQTEGGILVVGRVTGLDHIGGLQRAAVHMHVQTLGRHNTLFDHGTVGHVHIGDTGRCADGVIRHGFLSPGIQQITGRTVHGTVGTLIHANLAQRGHFQSAFGRNGAFGADHGLGLGKHHGARQRAHQLGYAAVVRHGRLTAVLEQIAQRIAAHNLGKHLASELLVLHGLDAQEALHKGDNLHDGQLLGYGLVLFRNSNGYVVDLHAGIGVHADIARTGDHAGIAVYNRADREACIGHGNGDAVLGSHVEHVRGLAQRHGRGDCVANGMHADIAARINHGVVGHLHGGIHVDHVQRDGQRNDAAVGVGDHAHVAAGLKIHACGDTRRLVGEVAGAQLRVAVHRHISVAGSHGHGDGNHQTQQGGGRRSINREGYVGTGMDVTAGKHLAADGHVRLAELQGHGVDALFLHVVAELAVKGDEGLAQLQRGGQIHGLGGNQLRIGLNGDAHGLGSLVQTEFDLQTAIGIQIILDQIRVELHQRFVRRLRRHHNVAAHHRTGDPHVVRARHNIEVGSDDAFQRQVFQTRILNAVAQHKIGHEQTGVGNNQTGVCSMEIHNAVHGLHHIVGEGLRHNALGAVHFNRLLVQKLVGEGVHVHRIDLEAFHEVQIETAVKVVDAQYGNLRHGLDGNLHIVGTHAFSRNALVFIDVLIQLAGDMQAIVAFAAVHRHLGFTVGRKGSRGIHGQGIVAFAAADFDGGIAGRYTLLLHDSVHSSNHSALQGLAVGEGSTAVHRSAVIAGTGGYMHVGAADVNRNANLHERTLFSRFRTGDHLDIRAVGQGYVHRIVACAGIDRHFHGSGSISRRQAGFNAFIEGGSHGVQRAGHVLAEVGQFGQALGHLLIHVQVHYNRRGLGYVQINLVVAVAGDHGHRAGDVGYVHLHIVVLLGAVVFHGISVVDVNQIAGRHIQTRQHHVQALDIKVD